MNRQETSQRSGRVHPASSELHIEATGMPIQRAQQSHAVQTECRICIEAGGNLIRPCLCSGSAAYVHYQCLKMWIEKRSQDKDGIVRHFQRVDCEMCKHQFSFHTRTKESFSCSEYTHMDTCRAEIVLELFFIGFFVIGTLASGVLLSRGITSDLENPPETLKFSVSTICLMLAAPISLGFAVYFIRSFLRSFFVRQERMIVSIEEYRSQEPSRVPLHQLENPTGTA